MEVVVFIVKRPVLLMKIYLHDSGRNVHVRDNVIKVFIILYLVMLASLSLLELNTSLPKWF